MREQGSSPVFRMAAAIAIGVTSVIVISWLLKREELSAPVRLGLAVIPVLAYAYCLISYLRLIQMGDEMQRRIQLEALAIAFPTSAVAMLGCEYLRKAGFMTQFKPDYAFTLMLVLWAIGYLIAWRRYQ